MAEGPRRLSPRKQPRQQRAVETRDRLLDAAARVFSHHGYAAGTTNRIAEAAGASVGSLYQYFPNKDAILVALVHRHVEEGAVLLADMLERTEGRPLSERIPAILDAVLANHTGDMALHQVLFEEAPRPPELLDELRVLEQFAVAIVEDLIRTDPHVAVQDPAMAARVVVIAIESLVHRYVSGQHAEPDLDSFRIEVVAMLTAYLQGTSTTPN